MHSFFTNVSQYSRYTCYLQQDSTHFGLKLSAQFGPKNQQYSQRCLELHQILMNNFHAKLCLNHQFIY